MLGDCGAKVVITDQDLDANGHGAGVVEPARVLRVDALPAAGAAPAVAVGPDDAAYLIYTSGSTGKPKGVRVPQRAVVNFLAAMRARPGLSDGDRLVAVTTLSFDIAVLELLLPLAVGAEIVLATREQATDGTQLAGLLAQHRATLMQATPATWRMLLEAGWRGGAAFTALCGGEALPPELAEGLLRNVGALWNMYGPTETTVWSTVHKLTEPGAPIFIGHPIANTTVHVLDEDLQPVPVGVVGELYIGGDGVTLGYHHRPELTAERFVADPSRVVAGAKLYRTGDLGRWRALPGGAGALECLGRTDFQVKLRGYRIELGEIEVALARHPAIAQATVVTREDRPGDVRLIGYMVARPGAALPGDDVLRDHLAAGLPDYMIPSRFVGLDKLPLTGSGKVDRKALPAPSGPAVAGDRALVAPRTPTEDTVAAAYQAVLALPRLSVHDDFFALGGHSLLVAQMTARLARTLGRAVPMRAGFEHTTVASLAAWLDGAKVRDVDAPVRIVRRADKAPAPLSLMQQRVWYLEQLQLGRTVFNVPSAHRLHGALDVAALGRAFAQLVRRQPVLRTQIGTIGDAPAQIVLDEVDAAIPFTDLTSLPADQREPELARRLEAEIAYTFDLRRAPLFRVRLYKLADDHHVLYFMSHHIVWDGWSFDLFYEEMSELYAAYRDGRAPTRPEPPVSYADFSAWHRDWLTGPELQRQLEHWRGKLAGAPDALDVPTDFPRPPTMSGDGATGPVRLQGGVFPLPFGAVTVNVDQAPIPEAAKLILGETLGYNYVLDPRIQGSVTLVSNRPLSARELLSAFEAALRLTGASLVRRSPPAMRSAMETAVAIGRKDAPTKSGMGRKGQCRRQLVEWVAARGAQRSRRRQAPLPPMPAGPITRDAVGDKEPRRGRP